MLADARRRIDALPPEALILDVGGWGSPLPRADWVIDLMPHATRGLYDYPDDDRAAERFTERTWVLADICAHEPWPFADDQFDLVVCSHTLEDVRDPLRVCEEMSRVARAGYVETPSRLEEQIWGVSGGEWVGWGHHRWYVETDPEREGGLAFTFKHHDVHGDPSRWLPKRLRATLSADERVISLWWTGELPARERVLLSDAEIQDELRAFADAHRGRVPPPDAGPSVAHRVRGAVRRRLRG